MAKQQQHRSAFAAAGSFLLGLLVILVLGGALVDWLATRWGGVELYAKTREMAFSSTQAYLDAVKKLEAAERK